METTVKTREWIEVGKRGKPKSAFGALKGRVSVDDLKKIRAEDAKNEEKKLRRLLKRLGPKTSA